MSQSYMTILCLCSVLVLLPRGSNSATFVAERESQVIRRERPAHAVRLSAHGEMIEEQAQKKQKSTDYCNEDYPLGKENTKAECNDPEKDQIIEELEMCMKAAALAGATAPRNTFNLASDDFNHHPKGCFYMKDCSEDIVGNCYFYNGVDTFPTGSVVTGTPVCSRPKFLNGTHDSQGGSDGGCPTDYGVIMDETACENAAICQSLCVGYNFRVGMHNASRHRDFPMGCFINNGAEDADDGCVYFNPPTSQGNPQGPKGTPICNVTSPTSFWDAKNDALRAIAATAAPAAAAAGNATTAAPA